jgi:hypothetical protein
MTNEMVIIGAVALGFAVLAALAGIGYTVDFFVALRRAKPSTKP